MSNTEFDVKLAAIEYVENFFDSAEFFDTEVFIRDMDYYYGLDVDSDMNDEAMAMEAFEMANNLMYKIGQAVLARDMIKEFSRNM